MSKFSMQKFVQDLTWHLNMLNVKHLQEIVRQQAAVAARGERAQVTTEKTSIPSVEHGIVPIPGRLTLL